MYKVLVIVGLLLILISSDSIGQANANTSQKIENDSFCISQEEMILYNLINDLRRQNKLPVVQLSKSLSIVSKIHIDDLLNNKPQDKDCGLHSWSNKGFWKPCCYNTDPMGGKCMNAKPSEITGYPGIGFELVYWEEESATANEAYELWKQLDASRDMILNKGKWQLRVWKAMGIGIKNGYAVIWLGDKADASNNIYICGRDTLVQVKKAAALAANNKVYPKVVNQESEKSNSSNSKLIKPDIKKEASTEPARINAIQTTDNHYFIIVASLKTEKLAKEKIAELNSKGYSNAILLPSADRYRVSLGSYPNERLTKEKMKELKLDFPDCWLLRQ
jgi:hypothetical protein